MCGIAGILGIQPATATVAARQMLAAMRHRGPDGEGIRVVSGAPEGPPLHLLHARLSLLDLTAAGAQPMVDGGADAELTIAFNGEIYNHQELRRELTDRGYRFATRTDTEVVLKAYRAWGPRAAERLRGMFAIVIADPAQRRVWFCRDRLGIKALYLARVGGGCLFASEVRTLLAATGLLERRLSRAAMLDFLAHGALWQDEGAIVGVTQLAPGVSMLTDWSGRELDRRVYWSVDEVYGGGRGAAAAPGTLSAFAATLRTSVAQHLSADVPVGVFLSGGVDSTAMATIGRQVVDGPLDTLSLGFDAAGYDETQDATAIAKHLGTRHHAVRLTGAEVAASFSAMLQAIDQPSVDGFNTFAVTQAARRQGLKAALSGVGGDELFGGYATFTDVPRALRLARLAARFGALRGAASVLLRRYPRRAGPKLAALLERPASLVELYGLRRELFLPREIGLLVEGLPAGARHGAGEASDPVLAELPLAEQISALELTRYLRFMLLRDADVMSMANGFEVRVPLLDHAVVEAAAALRAAQPARRGAPKSLLVEAAGQHFPRWVLARPKRGFAFPWTYWLRGPLQERCAAAFADRAAWQRIGLRQSAVLDLWRRFLAADRRVPALQILALLVLDDFAGRHALESAA